MTPTAPTAARFAHIDTWVFDLDNTLYPQTADLWPKIDARITLFMMRLFGLDAISLRALQKHYYLRYGTTLRGLMIEHNVDAGHYLEYVHDIDRSCLDCNHSLAAAIAALPGRKLILTNGSRHHAIATAKQLGIDHLFEDIFDILAADFIAKPEAANYERFFDKLKVDPAKAALFEDLPRNLVVPHARGMTTVLVLPGAGENVERETWEIASGDEPHVDFVTDDLVGFWRNYLYKFKGEAKMTDEKYIEGNEYKYAELMNALKGGSHQFYLPYRGNRVFAAFLIQERIRTRRTPS